MAQDTKKGQRQAAGRRTVRPPVAESVGREPTAEPTPELQAPPIDREDEPKGQPTSDRFHTEQAHRKGKKGS